jgi:tetratricopeptide (TPR) repeat protein
MRLLLFSLAAGLALSTPACKRSAQDLVARGNQFAEQGQVEDALLNYRKAIQTSPHYGEAYHQLGVFLLKERRVAEAYQTLTRAVELLPEREDPKIVLADLCMAAYVGDPERPKMFYDQLARLASLFESKHPMTFDSFRVRGQVALVDRKPTEAIRLFEQANQVKPSDPTLILLWVQALFQNQQEAEAEKLAKELIAARKDAGPMYDVLYNHYQRTSRRADAEAILREKTANNPKEAAYRLQLAGHYVRAGNQEAAQDALQSLLDHPADFPQARLQVGDFQAQTLRNHEAALQHYREGLKGNVRDANLYRNRMVRSLLALGKRPEAEALVAEILKENPKDADARTVRAELWVDSGKPENIEKAVQELKTLAAEKRNTFALEFSLGRALAAAGDWEGAAKAFQQAAVLDSTNTLAQLAWSEALLRRYRPEEAQRIADQVLARNPNEPRARLLRGVSLMKQGQNGPARAELTRLTRDYPRYGDAQLQLAALNLAENKVNEAEAIFQKLYQPGQNDLRPLDGLLSIWRSRKQFDRALKTLAVEQQRSPERLDIRMRLASTAVGAGKYDLALEQYRQLLEQEPQAVERHMLLANTLLRMGEYNQVIPAIEKAAGLAPADPRPLMLLALALDRAGRRPDAIRKYREALKLQPDNPMVANNLAYLLAETGGDLDEAQRLVQGALAKHQDHPTFTDTLGWVYLKRKRVDSASAIFEGLAKRQPQNPTFRYHFGMALLAKGDRTRAREEFTAALAAQPSKEEEREIQQALAGLGGT